jgi:hypothetical protein
MGLLEDVRKRNSSGSLLRKYRSKFDISEDSINETLSSIKSTMENDRLKTVYDSQGVSDVQQQIIEKENQQKVSLGLVCFLVHNVITEMYSREIKKTVSTEDR